jgi:RNA recognition motif-containing protein
VSKKLFVGNLPFRATDEELNNHFSQYGNVLSVAIIMDRQTGRSRGFGFVEMDDNDALAAIQNLDGKEFNGRELRISEAREKSDRPYAPRHEMAE